MPLNWSLGFHPGPLQWLKSDLIIPVFPNTPVASHFPQGKSQHSHSTYNDTFAPRAPLPVWPHLLAHSTPVTLANTSMIPPGNLCTCSPLLGTLFHVHVVHSYNLREVSLATLFKTAIPLSPTFPYLSAFLVISPIALIMF